MFQENHSDSIMEDEKNWAKNPKKKQWEDSGNSTGNMSAEWRHQVSRWRNRIVTLFIFPLFFFPMQNLSGLWKVWNKVTIQVAVVTVKRRKYFGSFLFVPFLKQ